MNTNSEREINTNDVVTRRIRDVETKKGILEKQITFLFDRVKVLREELGDVLNIKTTKKDGVAYVAPDMSCPLSVYLQDRVDMTNSIIEEINDILDRLEI